MSGREVLTLEPFNFRAGLPPRFKVSALAIDGHGDPILTCHMAAVPRGNLSAPSPPTLKVAAGWPPVATLTIGNPGARFPIVQRIDGQWLVVDVRGLGGRPNAWKLGPALSVVGAFNIADAISDLQVDEAGNLWVARFDENPGLDLYDARGRHLQDFSDHVFDCYAMNVVSSREVWLCDYPDFRVRVVRDGRLEQVMDRAPVEGSQAIAIVGMFALFGPGYEQNHLTLVNHRSHEVIGTYSPVGADGEPFCGSLARGRGTRVFMLGEGALAGVELREHEPHVVPLRLPTLGLGDAIATH